jgi:hypothetical protein
MISSKAYLFISFAAAIVGIICACYARKVPSRGWVAVLMLLSVTLASILIDAGNSSSSSHLSMSLIFCLCSPFAVVYSFRSRRHAPDRLAGLAAFVGAFIVGGLFLLMLGTAAYYVFLICTHAF